MRVENQWKGIDVSDNQGVIDWQQVKSAGVEFAILRSVRRSGKPDHQFAANISGCRAQGIPVSVYKYTYATLQQASAEEARQVVALLQSHGLEGTLVWWDVEDRGTLRTISAEELTSCIRAAQAVIEAAGYRFGIYVGLYVYRERWFDFDRFATVPLWVARYPSRTEKTLDYTPAERYKPNVGRAIWGWQYSSNGRIPGIFGPVDLDVCYQDLEGPDLTETESGVIWIVSVADVWTQSQAEEVQRQLAAFGISGVAHKVQILE